MGVTYKLRDEVVHFIISQRQGNPLSSCRQLAESASLKFDLHLSKSSVHDVLKENGIITPRGRKPKDKFTIPQEKKKQIQASLSQIKLLPDPVGEVIESSVLSVIARSPQGDEAIPERTSNPVEIASSASNKSAGLLAMTQVREAEVAQKNGMETSPEHEAAGKVFYDAAYWDLGISTGESPVKQTDWDYYLTYSKGIKIILENNQTLFIDFPMPLERCIKETVDGLVNNVKPLMVHKVSDEELFKACMEGRTGFKISTISIVDQNDHNMLEFNNIMEYKRSILIINRLYVDSNEKNALIRSKILFFPQVIDNNNLIDKMMNLRGFESVNKDENMVTLLMDEGQEDQSILEEAVERLNRMYLRDGEGRLVKVKISLNLASPG